jgi:hypothetical protein
LSESSGETVPADYEQEKSEATSEEERSSRYAEVEEEYSDLFSSIRTLEQESVQINELAELEHAYSKEISTMLRQFLLMVGKSYELDPATFPRLGGSVGRIVLTPQGSFSLTYRDGLTAARPVEDLSAESLVNVLDRVLPEVADLFAERRRKLEQRTALLEKVSQGLKRISPLSKSGQISNA